MSESEKPLPEIFGDAHHDAEIRKSRLQALAGVGSALNDISNHLDVTGYVTRDQTVTALGLLTRLGSDLIRGLGILIVEENVYGAAALLRQTIEVEYLLFIGYQDPARIRNWYTADHETLRKQFQPQKMRNEAGGLFRDQEYWTHCELGGHPNPRARSLYAQSAGLSGLCFVVPDSVHHARRLWNSVRLLVPKVSSVHEQLTAYLTHGDSVLSHWESTENPAILAIDGLEK